MMKLVLFCDYGLDDAAATVDALSHAEGDGYEKVVLVAVGGNVPSGISLRNAKKLVAQCDSPHPEVAVVDTTEEPQPSEYLKDIHGGDGMGDLFPELPFTGEVLSFAEFLRTLSGRYDVLSLGPTTLVPRFLERGVHRKFVLMGGNIAEEPNFHGYEFNHALNRAAFAETVKLYPHVAVTMDTCRHPLLNIQEKEVAGEGLLSRIVRRSRELTFHSGEKGCYIWDDIAVKALRHPDWFETETRKDKDGNLLTVAKYVHDKEYLAIIDK